MSPLTENLNHHLADQTRALVYVQRAARENDGTRLGTFLLLLSWELEEDRDTLVRLMEQLGIHRRHAGAMLARLRPQGTLGDLDAALTRKSDMWAGLRGSVADGVTGIDFDELIHRAEAQSAALERRRHPAAAATPSGTVAAARLAATC
jgi:hypothetical protein